MQFNFSSYLDLLYSLLCINREIDGEIGSQNPKFLWGHPVVVALPGWAPRRPGSSPANAAQGELIFSVTCSQGAQGGSGCGFRVSEALGLGAWGVGFGVSLSLSLPPSPTHDPPEGRPPPGACANVLVLLVLAPISLSPSLSLSLSLSLSPSLPLHVGPAWSPRADMRLSRSPVRILCASRRETSSTPNPEQPHQHIKF